ncbi:MAG: cysteine--tRNA ligase, partial [Eubacteriales bacterium]|nr:cysteine--tRNA ligase [Eubacteriales bacterium]
CGGIDNAFPHHTNEIAQSEAYLGHKWCNYWMHVYHLNTNSGKMSKSAGEFLTVSLLQEKGYDPIAYRFFCLQSHYRKNLIFSWENLDNAATAYKKLIAKIAALQADLAEPIDEEAERALREKFLGALGNDLNTSLAITAVLDTLKYKTNDRTKEAVLAGYDTVLGLNLLEAAAKMREELEREKQALNAGVEPEVVALLEARTAAKKAKDFAEADRIRDLVAEKGYKIIDTPQGPQAVKA